MQIYRTKIRLLLALGCFIQAGVVWSSSDPTCVLSNSLKLPTTGRADIVRTATQFFPRIALNQDSSIVKVIQKEYAASAVGTLVVEAVKGSNISIVSNKANKVRLHIELNGKDWQQTYVDSRQTQTDIQVKLLNSTYIADPQVSHQITISVPATYHLQLMTGEGDIIVQGVTGRISGTTMQGNVTLIKTEGVLDMHTGKGEIRVENSLLEGQVSTADGNALFINTQGSIQAIASKGKVQYRFTENISFNTPLIVTTLHSDIDVARAPEGSRLEVLDGNIHIVKVEENVQVNTYGGSITIDELQGGLEAKAEKGNIHIHLQMDERKTIKDHHIQLTATGGDVTVVIPATASIDLHIEQLQATDDTYKIISDFPLKSEISSDELKLPREEKSKEKRAYKHQKLGEGKHLLRIQATNGNVYIKKRV